MLTFNWAQSNHWNISRAMKSSKNVLFICLQEIQVWRQMLVIQNLRYGCSEYVELSSKQNHTRNIKYIGISWLILTIFSIELYITNIWSTKLSKGPCFLLESPQNANLWRCLCEQHGTSLILGCSQEPGYCCCHWYYCCFPHQEVELELLLSSVYSLQQEVVGSSY